MYPNDNESKNYKCKLKRSPTRSFPARTVLPCHGCIKRKSDNTYKQGAYRKRHSRLVEGISVHFGGVVAFVVEKQAKERKNRRSIVLNIACRSIVGCSSIHPFASRGGCGRDCVDATAQPLSCYGEIIPWPGVFRWLATIYWSTHKAYFWTMREG
jgi:hypothetical protein